MTKTIISLDWDHTLRKMEGLDLNLLILILYSQSMNIPIGLTTHRDIENTTLYTLYPWINHPPQSDQIALSAAISYWNENFFSLMNITFDFINARYQPAFGNNNYYETILLPLENNLSNEIRSERILESQHLVRMKINECGIYKEPDLPNNQYKEKQLSWLCDQYDQLAEKPLTLIHLDDDGELFQQLPIKFSEIDKHKSKYNLNVVYVDNEFLLRNEFYLLLINKIGFIEYAKNIISINSTSKCIQLLNQQSVISACLLLAQMHFDNIQVLLKIKEILEQIDKIVESNLSYCLLFAKKFISSVLSSQRPIHLLSNDLKYFIL